MTWGGPSLTADQRDLVAMLDALAAGRDVQLADDPALVEPLVRELAELGVWTLGTSESAGGGGADSATTTVALERLGRAWPALGWAASQAHAAIDVLGDEPAAAALVAGLHAGRDRVAVVDGAAHHVRLAWSDGRLAGEVDRVDPAGPQPHLLVLVGAGTALLVPPAGLVGELLSRTGLAGAFTQRLTVDLERADVIVVTDAPNDAARPRLAIGAAAVAAGIAGAAADAADSYAAHRRQFGGPLTDVPVVRASLLGQRARTVVAATLAFGASTDPVSAHAVLSAACEAAVDVSAAAVQSHGGYGYLTEYPVERHLRDAVSLRAAVDVPGTARAAAAYHVGATVPRSELETMQ